MADPELALLTVPPREGRTWPAVLTLYFLAPFVGELLSGSTPVLLFFTPVSIVYQPALYGCGAILIREIARRRDLGWPAILLLGAAYGVIEEGLVVTSWFNPYWPDAIATNGYARWLDLSWLWALHLTGFHAVFSITIPILITELLFPDIAGRPWLSRRGRRLTTTWFGFACVVGFLGFGFLAFKKEGYTHPPATIVIAVGFVIALGGWALRFRQQPPNVAVAPIVLAAPIVAVAPIVEVSPIVAVAPVVASTSKPSAAPKPSAPTSLAAPKPWRVRTTALLLTILAFAVAWTTPHWLRPSILALVALSGLLSLSWLAIRRWSRRHDWNDVHRLALASGALWFMLLLAPLEEFGGAGGSDKPMLGQTLAALTSLVALILLNRRVRRRQPPPRLMTQALTI